MSVEPDALLQFSQALEARIAALSHRVVALRNESHRYVSGLVWQSQIVVTSEQAIGRRDEYEVVTTHARALHAHVVGRDPGTNILALRLDAPIEVEPWSSTSPRTGGLAIALAANVEGTTVARLGTVRSVGDQWFSRAGGRIEQRIALDIRLGRTEEGGPVFDAAGALIGMSTLGRPGEVLAIPSATLERVVPQLLDQGRVRRGWLGVALQPIAITDALADQAGQQDAMMIMSVVENGPAANAGVTVGDILLTVDGVAPRGMRRLMAQLSEGEIGKWVELRLLRGGQIIKLEAQIGTRP